MDNIESKIQKLEEGHYEQQNQLTTLTVNVNRLTESVQKISDLTMDLSLTKKDMCILNDQFKNILSDVTKIIEKMNEFDRINPEILKNIDRITKLESRVTELENSPARNLKNNFDKYKGLFIAAIVSGIGISVLSIIKEFIRR